MAKGRCESEPMPWDNAAGSKPSDATNIVIIIGRSRRTAPSMAAASTGSPWPRIWLMYSSMITPVSTDTPNSARNPTPDETLKCVPVMSSARMPPKGATATLTRIRMAHLLELNMAYKIT